MTIASNLNKHTYSGNGATKIWPYTFPIVTTDGSDIKVYLTTVATGAVAEVTSNFTVDTANKQITYPVTGDPLTSAYKITLLRVEDITQETDLVNQGPFLAEVIETVFDKLTAIDQQQQEQLNRAIKIPVSTAGIDIELPTPVALHSFRWNATGNGLETTLDPATVVESATAQKVLAETARTGSEAARDISVAARNEAQRIQTEIGQEVKNVALAEVATIQADITASKNAAAGSAINAANSATAAAASASATNNASPKGVYATLAALQTAYPTGTTGIYLVTADGKWYYWNSSAWTAGGVYQSTGIVDKSITRIKLADKFLELGYRLTSAYDLNNIVAEGNYFVTTAANKPTELGATAGFLTVQTADVSVVQTIYNYTDDAKMWRRSYNGSVWTTWRSPFENLTYVNFSKSYNAHAGVLGTGYDCNYLTDEGYYIVKSGVLNAPTSDTYLIESKSYGNTSYCIQKAYLLNKNDIVYSRQLDKRYPETVVEWENISRSVKVKKKWLAMGDSITNAGGSLAYAVYASNILQTTLSRLSSNGATMSVMNNPTYDPYSFALYTSTIDFTQYDFLTIAYGTNDFGNSLPLGIIDSTDNTTFLGAFNTGLQNVYNSNPKIKILVFTPIYRSSANTTNGQGLKLYDYCQAIINAADKYNLPVFNAYKTVGINQLNYTTFLADGLHPNADGAEKFGSMVAGQIQSLI